MKQIEKVNVGFFKSNAREIINKNNIETVISDAGNELINRISEWISEGSGCVIKSVVKHEIVISKYQALRGSSYLPLPEKIKSKKATINIKKKIMNALDGAIWRSYFLLNKTPSGFQNNNKKKQTKKKKKKKKKQIDRVKYDQIDFPVKIKDIPKIENMNDDIRFNVYGVTKDQTIYPLYTSNRICDKTCNLLLIENGNENHYV